MLEPDSATSVTRNPPATGRRRPVTDGLLLAAGRGDLDAFAAFYDATAPMVLGLVHRVLDEPGRAERVLEEAYLVLWRCAPAFDPAVRSADATLLATTRRVLVGPVRAILAPGCPAGCHRKATHNRCNEADPRYGR